MFTHPEVVDLSDVGLDDESLIILALLILHRYAESMMVLLEPFRKSCRYKRGQILCDNDCAARSLQACYQIPILL